ncbi:MAG: hypothetical protein K0R73_551 [Candidatus Midichloriaceae bacterium]|jgi:hypothetical protein|nr:hypothetical protein [Candidatus Midichloriaceae bacterium]
MSKKINFRKILAILAIVIISGFTSHYTRQAWRFWDQNRLFFQTKYEQSDVEWELLEPQHPNKYYFYILECANVIGVKFYPKKETLLWEVLKWVRYHTYNNLLKQIPEDNKALLKFVRYQSKIDGYEATKENAWQILNGIIKDAELISDGELNILKGENIAQLVGSVLSVKNILTLFYERDITEPLIYSNAQRYDCLHKYFYSILFNPKLYNSNLANISLEAKVKANIMLDQLYMGLIMMKRDFGFRYSRKEAPCNNSEMNEMVTHYNGMIKDIHKYKELLKDIEDLELIEKTGSAISTVCPSRSKDLITLNKEVLK